MECNYPHNLINKALQWRHIERDGVSNHWRLDCSLNRLFRRRSKKASKLHVTGLTPVNSPHKGPVTLKCFHLMTSSWVNRNVQQQCRKTVYTWLLVSVSFLHVRCEKLSFRQNMTRIVKKLYAVRFTTCIFLLRTTQYFAVPCLSVGNTMLWAKGTVMLFDMLL